MADVTFNYIFPRRMEDYHKMNTIYGEYFKEFLPARFRLKGERERPEFLGEIATTAVITH